RTMGILSQLVLFCFLDCMENAAILTRNRWFRSSMPPPCARDFGAACSCEGSLPMATPLQVLILEDCALDAELMLDHLREAGFDPQSRIVDTEPAYLAQLDPTLDLVLS